jgi:hypothetical protein
MRQAHTLSDVILHHHFSKLQVRGAWKLNLRVRLQRWRPRVSSERGLIQQPALLERPGIKELQLDLFLDYAANVALYPGFQACSATSSRRLLRVCGKHDPFFIPPGAEAYRRDSRDNTDTVVEMLDTGH